MVSVGGVSYHSVGLLRPLEVSAQAPGNVIHASGDCYIVFTIVKVVVVAFALPTPSDAATDKLWVKEFIGGCTAGASVAAQVGASCVVWMGDFNMEPTALSGKPDPKQLREQAWNVHLAAHNMQLLNPSAVGPDGIVERCEYID